MPDIAELAPPAAPDLSSTTPNAPAPGISEAGAALRAEGWGTPEAPADSVTTDTADPVAETAAPTGEQEFTQDEKGVWHRPDGQFASADEIERLNAAIAEIPSAPTAEAEPAPDAIVVPLKSRDGSTLEIEVTDPKIAELLRANANDGMRREEFNRQVAEVAAERAEQQEFRAMMRTNPEAVILRELPADKQISIATALVAQHWDAIYEKLVQFQEAPTERVTTAMQTQIAMRDQDSAFRESVAHSRYITQAETAIRSLVPESADDAASARFIADAANDIAAALRANGNQPVAPEKFREILAPRLALYGFTESAGPSGSTIAPAAVPVPPARPVARPVAKAASPAAPSVPVPSNAAATVRHRVQAQRIAASIAPHGAGAATVKAPLVPSNADVTAAGQAMRQQKSWGLTA